MIKKYFKAFAFIALTGLTITSCGDFGDVNEDPNNPGQPNTAYMFSFACRRIADFTMGGTYNDNTYNPWTQLYPQYIAERQNVQYGTYNIQDFGTGDYYRYELMDLKKIIDFNSNKATKDESYVASFGASANQIAVARTLSGYYFMHFTDALGMIPYSEALKGDEDNYTPKLDSQKDVYTGLHKDLKEAYDQFTAGSLDGNADFIYGGDVAKWKKLNASIRMLMAIKLKDVDPATGNAWFAEAYQDGAIESNEDNLVYPFYANTDNQNFLYGNILGGSKRRDFAPCKTLVDQMNTLQDPRRPLYFTANGNGEYKGIPIGIAQADVTKYNGDNSDFNPAMYQMDSPMIVISASRILSVEAEAALYGWISADPKALYEKSIALSFAEKAAIVNHNTVSEEAQANYMRQAAVAFTGSDVEKLNKIALQRWINGYMEDGVEAWSDWRRLNYPKMVPGPAVTQWNHIPYRKVYGSSDISANPDQYQKAIKEQGEDTYNTRVWWDVADNN